MDWKKLGIFGKINRIDVWQNIFEFLDVKTVLNSLSKSCKSFKMLCTMHFSHIKAICILSLLLDSFSSYTNMVELLKFENTFLLKINSNMSSDLYLFHNKSVMRFYYKSQNGHFSTLLPLIKSIKSFNHFKLKGNTSLPAISEDIFDKTIKHLEGKNLMYLKISKLTLTQKSFKSVVKFIKEKTPMTILLDISCFSDKTTKFQKYLTVLWKNKWLLSVEFKVNGKLMFSSTREALSVSRIS